MKYLILISSILISVIGGQTQRQNKEWRKSKNFAKKINLFTNICVRKVWTHIFPTVYNIDMLYQRQVGLDLR